MLHHLSSLEAKYGVDSEQTLNTLDDLCRLFVNQGRYRSGETYARRCLSASRTLYGDHDHRTGHGLSILGSPLYCQGHHLQAKNVLQKASDILKRTLPSGHEVTLRNEFRIGLVQAFLNHPEEALMIFRRTEETALGVLGPVHATTLNVQVYLIHALLELRQFPEAEQRLNLLMTKLREYSSTLDSRFLTLCRIFYASLLRKTSRLEEAADVLETLLQESMGTDGPEHPLTLKVMYDLAETYVDRGRIPEALDKINLCISGSERVLGPDHPDSKLARGVRDKILDEME